VKFFACCVLPDKKLYGNCNRFFKVFEARFGSLELKIWSLESAKIIIGSLKSEKIGSLESEKSGRYRSIPVPNIFFKKTCCIENFFTFP